jgi:O-antigen ligase
MCLEIVVFIEPAPVDVLIVFCLVLSAVLGKLDFGAVPARPFVALAVFALANLISMYDPLDPSRAAWYVFVTLYLLASWLFFTGLTGRYGQPMITTLINTYCVAGLVSAFLGIGGYLHLLPFQDTLLLQGRARGLFKDCNVYGPYFVPMALFALTRLLNRRVDWNAKLFASVIFLAALVAMLFSFSRACWLNFGVAMVVFFAAQQIFMKSRAERQSSSRTAALVVCASALGVVLLINAPPVKQMLSQRVTSNGLQDYDRVRFATQGLSFQTAEERPLGIGPGQAEEVLGYATHSMYLRILSENGIAALLALLVFIGATMARALAVVRYGENQWFRELNLAVFACIAGHLINSIFIDTVHWRHIWFIYALPWAPARLRAFSWRSPFPVRRLAVVSAPRTYRG